MSKFTEICLVGGFLWITACSSKPAAETAQPKIDSAASTVASPGSASPNVNAEKTDAAPSGFAVVLKDRSGKEVKSKAAPSDLPTPTENEQIKPTPVEVSAKSAASAMPEAAAPAIKTGKVPSDKAYGWLKNGNTRFLKNNLRKDGQSIKDVRRVSKRQTPHAVVLSSSDSRIPPEIIFDQKLGEIFTVRTVGPDLDSSSIASIEFAVANLGANLIVVLGHNSSGAIKAAYTTLKGGDAGSPSLNYLVKNIRERIKSTATETPSAGYIAEAWANVHGISQELGEKSEIIKTAMKNGTLKIVEAMYNLETGKVEFK